jgi:hypothetical protein
MDKQKLFFLVLAGTLVAVITRPLIARLPVVGPLV